MSDNIIHYYNRLNGKSISLDKLKEFRARVEKHIESTGTGPHLSDLKGILSRVSKGIKDMISNGAEIAERLELIPIEVKRDDGKILRVASGYEETVKAQNLAPRSSSKMASNVVAIELPINQIHTDTKRFQNRMDAYSEASANSVAENYDPNKFDPIVVWIDPKKKKTFVLSGHSRYEGMKRRGSKTVAVRYFKGNEEQAIKFAKVEANRAANQESLIEDLAAYRLMRDGDEAKGIKKLNKTELAKIFKGKVQKLDAYSYLAGGGLFVNALNQGTTSNYPYLERNAQWIGQLRKENPVITNAGEDNIFHFFYSDKSGRNLKQSKEEFFKLAQRKINQLGKGEGVLFPECSSEGCVRANDKESDPIKGETYKRLREISEQIAGIREKLSSKDPKVRVTTEEEKKYLRDTAQRLESEKEKIQRDLDIMDKSQSSLFGTEYYGLNGPQYDAFDIQPKKRHRGPLNPLQMAQLQDAIKAGRTPKVNLKAKLNAKEKSAPLFDEPVHNPRQASLFGMSASSLAGMEFKTLPFTGKWKDHFGLPSENFSAMVWGKPKQGKTHYSFQMANYLSQFGEVLYVLSDEGIGYTVKEKIIANGLDKNDKVKFFETRDLEQIEKAIKSGSFKFVFIDLISNVKVDDANLKPGQFHELRKRHPQISFIPVFSSTKAGNFKGDQDWGHDVDVLVDVAEGIANAQGRFGGGHEYHIFKSSTVKPQNIAAAAAAKASTPKPTNP